MRQGRVLMCFVMTAMAIGCAGQGKVADGGSVELAYPAEAPRGEALDILIVQHPREIEIVNRTAAVYEHVHLWLNQQYGAGLRRIKIGTEERYSLRGLKKYLGEVYSLKHFINEHGEHVPMATFLAPDRAAEIVSAELFDPATGLRHVLTVRQGQ